MRIHLKRDGREFMSGQRLRYARGNGKSGKTLMEVFSEGKRYQTWECVCGRDGRIYVGDIYRSGDMICKVCSDYMCERVVVLGSPIDGRVIVFMEVEI
jgi:hypothetical protein